MNPTPISLGFVLGVRPEAIKLGPVISEIKKDPAFRIKIFVTGQHREMLDQALGVFNLTADFDLDLMVPSQSPDGIISRILRHLPPILKKERPEMVIVQGDTATTFAGALSSFHCQIPIAHVEAGLRTYQLDNPFPEEGYRKMISSIAEIHFAPTNQAKENLLKEGINEKRIFVTGNTVIDALQMIKNNHLSDLEELSFIGKSKYILVTAHRRENFGAPMVRICQVLKSIKKAFPEIEIVFVLHKNPSVQQVAYKYLEGQKGIHLLDPPNYDRFISLMKNAYLILTDSGGLQEEGAALNVPVLILRSTTERPEGLMAGVTRLVGNRIESIMEGVAKLLTDKSEYLKMLSGKNPFGDGQASLRIAAFLKHYLRQQPIPLPWDGSSISLDPYRQPTFIDHKGI